MEDPFSDTDTASECGDEEHLPPLILDIFRREKKIRGLDLDLAAGCELLRQLFVTDKQCEGLERATVGQRKNNLWQQHRRGRVTASMVHKILGAEKGWGDIAKKIVNGGLSLENIPAVKWGIEKEDSAMQTYVAASNVTHYDFSAESVGLFIWKEYPFLGASPDGLRHCSCHGRGLVEIKCPYRFRDVEPFGPHTNGGHYFLDSNGSLKKSSEYYTQVQFQMAVVGCDFTDFVVWSPHGCIIETVEKDVSFCEQLLSTVLDFSFTSLCEELVGKK
ncbi:uncharacterized protein LOC124160590 [Ischnura elegans]|uniref:uncharacterized protein LOC124160590 n=1 Tax=Ischnura elegans TaxID=197161 RepID=UPI001ED87D69|nr:uncharacterized protein LOC124160590 [Ischnura elegans]